MQPYSVIKSNLQRRINYLSRGLNCNTDLDEFIAIEESIRNLYNKKDKIKLEEEEMVELEDILKLCDETRKIIIENYNTRKKAELLNYPKK